MKRIIKIGLAKIQHFRYHRAHGVNATQALRAIEDDSGKLPRRMRNMAEEYARDVLGWSGFAPWLHVYAAIAREFKQGWIPDNYYAEVVRPNIKGEYGGVSYLNSLSSRLLADAPFPDLLHLANDLFIDPHTLEVVPRTKVRDYIFSRVDRVVLKRDSSNQGRGVYIFTKESFDIDRVIMLGNAVIQSYVDQHEFFARYFAGAVATVRMTTAFSASEGASLRACYLRLGQGADHHIKSATHIRVAVDLKTGELNDIGYLPDWRSIRSHPTSNLAFSGEVLPAFEECAAKVVELQNRFPYVQSIGWDLVVNADGEVAILEWNTGHNDIKFAEATQGPCFLGLGWDRLHLAPTSR